MAGKREKKRTRSRPMTLAMLLTALTLLLSLGGPRGAAVSSPVELAGPEPAPAAESGGRAALADDSGEAAAGDKVPAAQEETSPRTIPERAAVEDTYFEDAVFLGDSRTDGLRLYSGLRYGTFLCATGATVESVFTKAVETPLGKKPLLDALAETDCGKIYIMLGVNELGWNGTETFRAQSAALLRRLQQDHPEAELVIQSILPVSAEKDAEGRYVNNERIDAYNQVWMELAEEFDAAYLNVAEAVAGEDGRLPEELCYDGVHLKPSGCRLWLDYLRTHPVGDWEAAAETADGEAEGTEAS